VLSRSDPRPSLLLDISGVADAVFKPPGDQGVKMSKAIRHSVHEYGLLFPIIGYSKFKSPPRQGKSEASPSFDEIIAPLLPLILSGSLDCAGAFFRAGDIIPLGEYFGISFGDSKTDGFGII
jgi:hypothetical protein